MIEPPVAASINISSMSQDATHLCVAPVTAIYSKVLSIIREADLSSTTIMDLSRFSADPGSHLTYQWKVSCAHSTFSPPSGP